MTDDIRDEITRRIARAEREMLAAPTMEDVCMIGHEAYEDVYRLSRSLPPAVAIGMCYSATETFDRVHDVCARVLGARR